jgi:hypothetical protein
VNLKDGSVTFAKLAPDAQLWRDTGTTITPGANFTSRPIVAAASPPNGNAFLWGATAVKNRLRDVGASGLQLLSNSDGLNNDDTSKPSWLLHLNPGNDAFDVYRAPAGASSAFALKSRLDATGVLSVPGDTNGGTVLLGNATAKGRVQGLTTTPGTVGLFANRNWVAGNAQDDATKPSWAALLNCVADIFQVHRAPPGSTTQAILLSLDSTGQISQAGTSFTFGPSPYIGRTSAYQNGAGTIVEVTSNPGEPILSKPQWMLRLDTNADVCQLLRQAPNNGAQLEAFRSDAGGNIITGGSISTGGALTAPLGTGIRLTGSGAGLHCQNVGSMAGDGFSNAIAFGWDGTVKCRVDTTQVGTVTITSDARLKLDVQEDVPGLDAVLALRPISFEYDQTKREIGFPKGRHYGLIAQDVQPHAPLVVEEDESEDHWLELDYRLLVPVLIQAVKELAARVATLETA